MSHHKMEVFCTFIFEPPMYNLFDDIMDVKAGMAEFLVQN